MFVTPPFIRAAAPFFVSRKTSGRIKATGIIKVPTAGMFTYGL